MTKLEEALIVIEKAVRAIDDEIAGGFNPRTPRSQLQEFKSVLQTMVRDIELDRLPPRSSRRKSLSKIIVDSWPFDSQLGEIILEAESTYHNL